MDKRAIKNIVKVGSCNGGWCNFPTAAPGAEVVCLKCAAILRVDNANPLILKGMEESDLF